MKSDNSNPAIHDVPLQTEPSLSLGYIHVNSYQVMDYGDRQKALMSDRWMPGSDKKLIKQITRKFPRAHTNLRDPHNERDLIVGVWDHFLLHDASQTRKDFNRWLYDFRQSTAMYLPHHIHRDSLLPEVVAILTTWESIPLVPGTALWKQARIRLIRDLLLDGTFVHYQYLGLQASTQEIGDARLWIFEQPDGSLAKYKSLTLPWYSKGLRIENGQLVTKVVTESQDPLSLPQPVVDETFNTNRIRISHSILTDLIQGNRTTDSALSAALSNSSIQDPNLVAPPAPMNDPATSDMINELLAALNLDGDEEEVDAE
ncbi:MAG: hypothetical protein Q9168_003104 [Polycauliona sp. 1 TL-2023]